MFVIFGWEKSLKPLESILKINCYHCQNNASWSVWKETEWVSLFFVKIFPFINKYHLSCDVCGDAFLLNKEQARQSLSSQKRTKNLHDKLVSMIENHQFEELTQGQIIYRKAQFENR